MRTQQEKEMLKEQILEFLDAAASQRPDEPYDAIFIRDWLGYDRPFEQEVESMLEELEKEGLAQRIPFMSIHLWAKPSEHKTVE